MTDKFTGKEVNERRHCDEYIHNLDAPMCLRWFLFVRRLPALDMLLCEQNGVRPRLFADFGSRCVRVNMASRLGDVGITSMLKEEYSYEQRVSVEDLTNFREEP